MVTPIFIPKKLRYVEKTETGLYYSTGKRRKIAGDRETGIEDLPEEIVEIILSFLPVKSALSTTFLSKSWNLRVTKLTDLDFDEHSWKVRDLKFKDFVNLVLLNHSTESIHKFSLRANFSGPNIHDNLSNWIDTVIGRNIRVLCLDNTKGKQVDLPSSFYCCETLETVILKGCFRFSKACCLPKLTVLELHEVRLKADDGSFRRLISGCPRLQSLDIFRKKYANYISDFSDFSLKLERLQIHFEDLDREEEYLDWSTAFKVKTNTDRVGSVAQLFCRKSKLSKRWNSILEFVKSCHGLKVLELDLSRVRSEGGFDEVRRANFELSTITELAVKANAADQWSCVLNLLHSCVNLQVLNLTRSKEWRKGTVRGGCHSYRVRRCFSSSLGSVIQKFFS